jgi:ABC-type amino acid transport substrate-binding protein
MTRLLPLMCLLVALSVTGLPAFGQPQAAAGVALGSDRDRPLVIATRQVPPFAIRGPSGDWRGIAIDLWVAIADTMGVRDYRFVELGLTDMLEAVAAGRVDAAVAALTITAARERQVDFSHPFHTSGLGIAVQQHPGGGIWAVLKRLVSGTFLAVLGGLLALLTAVGALVWLVERRRNDQFPQALLPGIGAGLWWSAVTMTTVGYGDKAPATWPGRALAMIWMFAGIIMVSSFTAAITTSLTVGELDRAVQRLEDLYGARVLTLAGSTSDQFLEVQRVRHHTVDNIGAALEALAQGRADAVIFDKPVLKHLVAENHSEQLRVLPYVLQRQDYGIALPQGSGAREQVNKALLGIIRSESWTARLEQYLGREG